MSVLIPSDITSEKLADIHEKSQRALAVLVPLVDLHSISKEIGYHLYGGSQTPAWWAIRDNYGFAAALQIESKAMLEERGLSAK